MSQLEMKYREFLKRNKKQNVIGSGFCELFLKIEDKLNNNIFFSINEYAEQEYIKLLCKNNTYFSSSIEHDENDRFLANVNWREDSKKTIYDFLVILYFNNCKWTSVITGEDLIKRLKDDDIEVKDKTLKQLLETYRNIENIEEVSIWLKMAEIKILD